MGFLTLKFNKRIKMYKEFDEFDELVEKEFKGYQSNVTMSSIGGVIKIWNDKEGYKCSWCSGQGNTIEEAISLLKLELKKANELRISMEKSGASD